MLLARSLVESTTGRRRTARTNGRRVGQDWTRWLGRSSVILLARHLEEQIAGLDLESNHGNYLGNAAGPLGVEGCLHLHGLDREQLLTLAYPVARCDRHADDQTRERRADLWSGSDGSALGVSRTDEASERSRTSTSRGWPLSSKKMVRLPSAWGSPTAKSLTIRVFPSSISSLISSPGSGPKKNVGVGKIEVSE